MKVKYLHSAGVLIVGNVVLSKQYSYNLIKEAGAAIRFGGKASNETLLGAVYIATVEPNQN
jgi:hypothetical protein